MRRREYSGAAAIALGLSAALVASTWWFQVHVYALQGMSLGAMVRSEFSRENMEWQAAYWAAVYPLGAIGLALVYRFSNLTSSQLGAIALPSICTALCASALLFVHWLGALALLVPCIVASACAVRPNPSSEGTFSGGLRPPTKDPHVKR